MGCGDSKSEQAVQPACRVEISGPVDPPGMVLRPRRDARGVPIVAEAHDLGRKNITETLGYVAHYLHSCGKNLVLIAVGGAVNTILLHTRQSTHNVDLFSPAFSGSELSIFRSAIKYAEQRSPASLGENWLKNETGTISSTAQNVPNLIELAKQQNDVVFQAALPS